MPRGSFQRPNLYGGATPETSACATDPKGENPARIGRDDLCRLLGITPGTLSNLKTRGIAVHLGPNAYDMEKTVRAYVTHLRETASGRGGEAQVASLTAERARLAKEQADAQAIRNAALRGDLVQAAEVEMAWGDVLRKVRARILAVPSRLRQSLALNPSDADAIDRELRAALTELGNGDA